MRSHVTIAEIAEMKLPGLPDRRGLAKKATAEGWAGRQRETGGAGPRPTEYPITCLPKTAQIEIARIAIMEPDNVPAVVERQSPMVSGVKTDARELPASARRIAEARSAVLAEWDRLAVTFGRSKAADMLIAMSKASELPERVSKAITEGSAKRGSRKGISRATLYNWEKERASGGDILVAVAPKAYPKKSPEIPKWASVFMGLYWTPAKDNIRKCLRGWPSDAPVAKPSYDQVRRFLATLPPQVRNRKRLGARAMVSMQRYVSRDTSMLKPGDIYTADGKTFGAWVENPLSGKPFKPEVVTVLDLATRRAVGFACGVAESAHCTLDAFVSATAIGGICAIWYTDNGPGFDNVLFDDSLVGVLERLGVLNMDSLPDRSHSRGVIERIQRFWSEEAKELSSYLGRDMDKEAGQSLVARIKRSHRQTGHSDEVISWEAFCRWVANKLDDYNSREHEGLPKFYDPAQRRKRHATPMEAWNAFAADGDLPPQADPELLMDLARPMVIRKTNRALISLFGNKYYHPDLEDYHGQDVAVSYSAADPNQVWVRQIVRTPEDYHVGRLICVAGWDSHKTAYVPQSVLERAQIKRTEAAKRRAKIRIDDADAELAGFRTIEHSVTASPPRPAQPAKLTDVKPLELPAKHADGKPVIRSDLEWVQWAMSNRDDVTAREAGEFAELIRRDVFRLQLDAVGIDVRDVQELITSVKEKAA